MLGIHSKLDLIHAMCVRILKKNDTFSQIYHFLKGYKSGVDVVTKFYKSRLKMETNNNIFLSLTINCLIANGLITTSIKNFYKITEYLSFCICRELTLKCDINNNFEQLV
jgi:hypothetical protein